MMVKGLPLDSFSCLDYLLLVDSVGCQCGFFLHAHVSYQLFIMTVHIYLEGY